MSVTPALRIFPSRASGALYRLTPSSRSIQLPPRSSGAPWWGEPRQTSLASLGRQRCAGQLAVVASAARHQPAHAVAEDHQLVELRGPLGDQLLEQRGEGAPVGRDVQAAVVEEIDRRVAEVACERGAMVVPQPEPPPVVQAGAVDEEEQLAAGLRKVRAERPSLQLQRMAGLAQLHLDRERVARVGQVVTEHPVEHGEHRFPLRPGRTVADERRELRQSAVDAGAHQLRHAADAPVDQAGEGAGRPRERPAEDRGPAADGEVHGLDQIGDAPGRLDRQAARPAQIVEVVPRRLRHSSAMAAPSPEVEFCCARSMFKAIASERRPASSSSTAFTWTATTVEGIDAAACSGEVLVTPPAPPSGQRQGLASARGSCARLSLEEGLAGAVARAAAVVIRRVEAGQTGTALVL